MTLGDIIKNYREEHGISMGKFAANCSLSKGYISMIENGKNPRNNKEISPTLPSIAKIAAGMGMDLDSLLKMMDGEQSIELQFTIPTYPNIHPIGTVRLPVLGEIACGVPRYASEDRESYTLAGTDIRADFCLIAHGDSMTGARINDGDIVFIRKQDIVENGEIAAVVIGDEATLKRFFYYREKELLILRAENPKYPDLIYTSAELEAVHVLGLAIAFQSDVQ